MGFIKIGATKFGSNFQITAAGPIDGRQSVETFEDLKTLWKPESYPSYPTMLVSVAENNELYMLKSKLNEETGKYEAEEFTLDDSWKKIGVDETLVSNVETLSTDVEKLKTEVEDLVEYTNILKGDDSESGSLAELLTTVNSYTDDKIGKVNEEINKLSETSHTHSNMSVLESITSNKVNVWDSAESNANSYTDDKIGKVNEEINKLSETINSTNFSLNDGNDIYLVGGTAQTGNVGFYTSTNVIMNNGLIKAPNGFYQDSDENFKTFGDDIEIDFGKLKSLPKKYFKWNYVGDDGKNQIGTSAQAVRELYPEIVSEDKYGKLSVDYAKLSVVALKAVDELHEENEALKEKMGEMERVIEILKNRFGIE